jgi:hypothetical protein
MQTGDSHGNGLQERDEEKQDAEGRQRFDHRADQTQ